MPPLEGLIHKGLPPQLKTATNFLIFNVLWTFVLGEVTGNLSQVDRVWTFLPPLYTMIFTFYPLLDSAPLGLQQQGVQPRALLMTALQVLWSVRLTYNASRRGFFMMNSEDYRWIVFRDWLKQAPVIKHMPRAFLTVFNLLFIAGWQNILLALLGLPAYSASVSTEPLHWGDALLTGLILITLAIEFTADNQQYAFHNFKQSGRLDLDNEWPGARIEFSQADKERGFITKGLWAYSRHPNAAAEQSVWLFMTLFPLLTNSHLAHNFVDMLLILTPSMLLSSLFIASTLLTEGISGSKYPSYKLYKKRVGMFWPTDTARKALWLWIRGKKREVELQLWTMTIVSPKKLK